MRATRHIVMVGPFPPPVHGMAAINDAVYRQLRKTGVKPLVIDLAARSLDRSILVRFCRLQKVLSGLSRLVLHGWDRDSTLYMSVSGGLGQGYEILFLLLGRLRGMRIYLHHHSFSYLDRRSRLSEFLSFAAGPLATHVTLCSGMTARLMETYPAVRRVAQISNAAILSNKIQKHVQYRSCLQTVGFIGNISADKGAFEFLILIEAIVEEGIKVKAKLAGPFQDIETEREVHRLLAGLSNVEYVGPKYGLEKKEFLSNIDVLIFPTRYINEAEPLTIHEAMSHGLPVITYGRGCIPEIVGSESGKVIDPDESFGREALEKIKEWIASPKLFETASKAAAKRFSETVAANIQRWNKLQAEIAGNQKVISRETLVR